MGNIDYLDLIKYQHKIIINEQLSVVLILFLLLPLIASFQDIDLYEAASITQNYVSVAGLVLLGTVNFSESGNDFSDLLRSKSFSVAKVLLVRCGLEIFYLVVIMTGWAIFLRQFNFLISIPLFAFSGFAVALFWGTISSGIAIILDSNYSGMLTVLVLYVYVVFGMDRSAWYYPLALIVSPSNLKIITVIIIFVSLIVLFFALVIDYWLRK